MKIIYRLIATLALSASVQAQPNPEYDPTDILPNVGEGYFLTIDGKKHFLSYTVFGKKNQVGPAVISKLREESDFDQIGPIIGSEDGLFRYKPESKEFILKQYSIYLYNDEKDELEMIESDIPKSTFLDRDQMKDLIHDILTK